MQAARWAARLTSCSGSGAGTTQGQQLKGQGLGQRARGSSASTRRRLRRLPQARWRLAVPQHSLGFLARQSSRPKHLPRAQLATGTRFRRGGAGPWTAASFSVPGVGPCTGSGTTHCAEAANSRRVCFTAPQTQVWPVPEQTLPWLDVGAGAETHFGRGGHAGGAAGVLRGRAGPNAVEADDP